MLINKSDEEYVIGLLNVISHPLTGYNVVGTLNYTNR